MAQTEKGANIKATKERTAPPVSVYNFGEVSLPTVSEKGYEGWATYGEDNLFPQELITAWLQSSIHNALVNGITQMIAGAGVSIDCEEPPEDLEKFMKNINRYGDSLEDLVTKTAFDLYLHGYFGWQAVWNQTRTKIVELYHTPAEQIRSGIATDNGDIETYYVSWNWEDYRKKRFEPTAIPAFDTRDRSAPRQMIFTKQYRPNQYYYSTPSYYGGLTWITLDHRVAEFHLNNVENGFFPSSIIQFFNGDPTQEEKRHIELNFMNKFTGVGANKLVFVYNNNREEQVSFETYEPANLDKRFKELIPEMQKNIMIAHRVPSPLLFGIRDGGGLGNNAEELESSSLLMNKMVIVPFQQIIINELAKIFKINGWDCEISIDTLQPAQFLEGQTDDAEAETESEEQSFNREDSRQILPPEAVDYILNHLSEVGQKREELTDGGWVLVMEDDEPTEEGKAMNIIELLLKMTSNGQEFSAPGDLNTADPEEPSSLDRALWKIRYEYAGPRDEKNRDFCARCLDLNLIYRKEDIDEMSAPPGANSLEFGTYNIFDYKGSYGCRHRWRRLVFFRKRDSQGRFLPAEGLENDRLLRPGEVAGDINAALEPVDGEATKVNDPPSR